MEQLAPIELIDEIASRSREVLELGAGDGAWARELRQNGVDVVALDPVTQADGVQAGSHEDVRDYPGRSILMVWPPDGTQVAAWCAGAQGAPFIFAVGHEIRFDRAPPPTHDLECEIAMSPGTKGDNLMSIYALRGV